MGNNGFTFWPDPPVGVPSPQRREAEPLTADGAFLAEAFKMTKGFPNFNAEIQRDTATQEIFAVAFRAWGIPEGERRFTVVRAG